MTTDDTHQRARGLSDSSRAKQMLTPTAANSSADLWSIVTSLLIMIARLYSRWEPSQPNSGMADEPCPGRHVQACCAQQCFAVLIVAPRGEDVIDVNGQRSGSAGAGNPEE